MWFLIIVVILLTMSYFLWPKPEIPSAQQGKASLDDFSFPTNSSGRVIPEVFGTCHLYGNIIWDGDLTAVPITQTTDMGKQGKRTDVIGYSYFLGLAYAICGPVDSMTQFRMDDKITGTFNLTAAGSFSAQTGKNNELGGSSFGNSTIKAYLGAQTTADSYLAAKTGKAIAYKNCTYLVLQNAFVGDNVRACPSYSVVVKRTNLNAGWTNYDINGDANPAHILYYVMTKLLKISIALIDTANFQAVGNTLYSEGFGMSFVMSTPQEAGEWVKEVLRHIDGLLYFNPFTSLYTLKLIRDDYTLASCFAISESNASKIQFSRKGWEDTIGELSVKFTDRNNDFKENVVSATNTAARLSLGYRKSDSLNFMGISNSTNAQVMLARLLKKQSYPLASVKFSMSIYDEVLFPGDVINFGCLKLTPAISDMAVRVLSVTGDKDTDQEVTVDGLEDIFGIQDIQLRTVQGSLATAWDYTIQPIIRAVVKDAQHEMNISPPALLPLMVVPSGLVTCVQMFIQGDYKGVIDPCGYATLSGSYVAGNEYDSGGFTVQNGVNIQPLSMAEDQFQTMQRALIMDGEIMVYRNLINLGGAAYQLNGIMRGQAGTGIVTHTNGAPCYFTTVPARDVRTFQMGNTPTVSGLIVCMNGLQKRTLPFNYTYGFTIETPYPPSNLVGTRSGILDTVSWQTHKRFGGANYRAVDSFPAYEETPEGIWEVTASGITPFYVSLSGYFQRTDVSLRTYNIRSYLNGLLSEIRTITPTVI